MFQMTRDLYQANLFGTYATGHDWRIENNIAFPYTPSPRYFWVEAVPADTSAVERTNFYASVKNNAITITYPVKPTRSTQVKVYLHSKLEDLTKPVTVTINGKLVATRDPSTSTASLRSVDPTDPTFLYEDVMTVTIP